MAVAMHLQERIKQYESTLDGDVFRGNPAMMLMLYEPAPPPAKRTRISRVRPEYKTSAWGTMLENPELRIPTSREAREFRKRFRIPYKFLPSLVELGRWWYRQLQRDVAGQPTIPMEIKVLGVQQILGRGSCFSDVAQLSGMSVPSVHLSSIGFANASPPSYSRLVKLPVGEDLKDVMKIYEVLGYPGAMGSMDCMHVAWGRCPFSSARLYSGKEKFPSAVYETITDHSRRILACTKGYPGSRNDKNISRFDSAFNRIRKEEPYNSQEFNLRSKDGVLKTYKDAYVLVDGGYHKADVDWAGADGSTDKKVGPLLDMPANPGWDAEDVWTRYDNMFGKFREKLVGHFIYMAERRELAWTCRGRR